MAPNVGQKKIDFLAKEFECNLKKSCGTVNYSHWPRSLEWNVNSYAVGPVEWESFRVPLLLLLFECDKTLPKTSAPSLCTR